MKGKCIGILGSGKLCGKNVKDNTRWCTIHNPTYIRAKRDPNAKKNRELKQERVLTMIASKVGVVADVEKWALDEAEAKKINPANLIQVASFVRREMPKRITRLALMGSDLTPYLNPKVKSGVGPEAFSRRVWMMISWHLISDLRSYENLAMSSKKLYKVLLLDKVRHYEHPLKTVLKSPRIFFMPVYRILEFSPPENLDTLAENSGLPSVRLMMKAYASEYGAPKNPLDIAQRTCDVILALVKEIVAKHLGPDDEFEEDIKGSGIMSRAKPLTVPKFENCPIRVKTFRVKKDTFLVAQCYSFALWPQVERTLSDCLVSFDNGKLIRLMKVEA